MNQDWIELLATFNAHAVEYLVVGAHALAAHGHVRATKDLDVWVRPDSENAVRAIQALRDFGAPLQDLTEADLALPGLVFQIGVPPLRIDIITAIDGVDFVAAWESRITVRLGETLVPILSRQDLIANKRASGRLQDLADLERLEGLEDGSK